MVSIPITLNDADQRFDRFLRRRLPLRTLSDIYRMIRTGFARVTAKKSSRAAALRKATSWSCAWTRRSSRR